MGEYVRLRYRRKNFGKDRKLTKENFDEFWNTLLKGKIEFGCEKCEKGFIYKLKESGYGLDSDICECLVESQSLNETKKFTKYSNIPQRFLRNCTLKDWRNVDLSFDNLKSFLEVEEKNWLFIKGPAGSGKTYTSVLIAKLALLKEKSVYFTTVADLLDDLRPGEDPKTRRRAKILSKQVDVLVLDDIGHEKSSQWVREQLYMVINHRWAEMKMTIFTSNYPMEDLKGNISNAVYSRVCGESILIEQNNISDKRINEVA